jgi:hypothetical protein
MSARSSSPGPGRSQAFPSGCPVAACRERCRWETASTSSQQQTRRSAVATVRTTASQCDLGNAPGNVRRPCHWIALMSDHPYRASRRMLPVLGLQYFLSRTAGQFVGSLSLSSTSRIHSPFFWSWRSEPMSAYDFHPPVRPRSSALRGWDPSLLDGCSPTVRFRSGRRVHPGVHGGSWRLTDNRSGRSRVAKTLGG